MEMCRVCLATEKKMIELDETFINNYNLLTSLNIALLDGMPQLTCQTCADTIKYYIEFRDKCISSEKTLREIVSENVKSEHILETENITNSKKDIKIEVKEESDDFNLLDLDIDIPYNNYEEDLQDLIINKDVYDVKPKKNKKKKGRNPIIKTENVLQKLDTLENLLLCGLCSKSFDDNMELNSHLEIHKNDRCCRICGEDLNSLSQLLAHRLLHVPIKQYKCHICGKRYRSCMYLEHHYRNIHIEGDDPNLSCKHCSVKCSTPRKLNSHMMQVHSGAWYICDVCSKGFSCKANLKSHIKFHSENKMYVCDLCGFSCKHSGGLKDHKVRRHSAKKVYCTNCKRPFANQEKHDKHKCKNAETICPVCGLRVLRSRLSRHMRVHNAVARYSCGRCPAQFRSRGAFAAHTDRHDGNRTKQCEYCTAKFYSATVLIKHRRIHTGEKPYVCKICNKGFTGNHNLKVHMKVHGEYLIVKKNSEKVEVTNVTNS